MQESSYRIYAARAKIENISTFHRKYPNGSVFTVIAEKVYSDYSGKSQCPKEHYSVTVNDAGDGSSFAIITGFTALNTSPTEAELEELVCVGEVSPIGLTIPPYCFLEL